MGWSVHLKKVKWTEQVVSGLTPVAFQCGPVGLDNVDKVTGQ